MSSGIDERRMCLTGRNLVAKIELMKLVFSEIEPICWRCAVCLITLL